MTKRTLRNILIGVASLVAIGAGLYLSRPKYDEICGLITRSDHYNIHFSKLETLVNYPIFQTNRDTTDVFPTIYDDVVPVTVITVSGDNREYRILLKGNKDVKLCSSLSGGFLRERVVTAREILNRSRSKEDRRGLLIPEYTFFVDAYADNSLFPDARP